MRRSRPRVPAMVAVGSVLLALLITAALPALTATPAQAASPRSVIRDSQPSWAVPDAKVAQAPATKSVKARVYLTSRNPAGVDAAVAAVSNPDSAGYGHYLTPAQYRSRFGPTAAATAKVSSWLRTSGLRVSAPQQNGRYVEVTGSVTSAERAFGADLALYRHSGGTYQAPAASISVPSELGAYVLTVTGLNEAPARATTKVDVGAGQQTRRAEKQSVTQAAAKPAVAYPFGYRTARPCSLWYGQLKARTKAGGKVALPKFGGVIEPYTVCGYTPAQLRSAYGAPAELTGKGVTVAVIDAYLSPSLLKDANQYSGNTSTAPFTPGQFRTLVPAGGYTDQEACDAAGWSTEQALDVEAVHGFAPDAKVLYAAGRSCSGPDLFDAETAVIDENKASIISLSYGSIESTETALEARLDTALLKQAALQGIGVYVASGDNGDELISTGEKQIDTSGNNPYATAVGGTALGIGPQGQYWFEAGWGTSRYELADNGKSWVWPSFYGGSGGGISELFNRPTYQNGVIPKGTTRRGVPDVAMVADPNTGMVIGHTQEYPDGVYYGQYRAGGTSLASPLFAAAQALTSQALGIRLGFANPRLYALYKQQKSGGTKAFHDVTPAYDSYANARADYIDGTSSALGIEYTIRTFDDDTSLPTRTGWDYVTGVGTPRVGYYTASGR
jgi:subtilase family serine protease